RGIQRVDGCLLAGDGHAACGDARSRRIPSRCREPLVQPAEIGETRNEAEHVNVVSGTTVNRNDFVHRQAAIICERLQIFAEGAAIAARDLDQATGIHRLDGLSFQPGTDDFAQRFVRRRACSRRRGVVMQSKRRICGNDIYHPDRVRFAQSLRECDDLRTKSRVDALAEFDDQRLIAHWDKARSGQHGEANPSGQCRPVCATRYSRAASMRGTVARLTISSYMVKGFMSKTILPSKGRTYQPPRAISSSN